MAKSLSSQALEKVGKDWSVSSETREARLQGIKRFANFVQKMFGLESIQNLKPVHVQAYAQWLNDEGKSARTGANYMAHVRDICEAIGKKGIVAKNNAAYGFGGVTRQNPITENLQKVGEIISGLEVKAAAGDRLSQMMVATAAMRLAFGLRQKEAQMSHKVVMIDGKPHLLVEGAKGGLERVNEIRTAVQREALALSSKTARELGNANSRPIPPELTLKQSMKDESRVWNEAGGTREDKANMHASRHTYAQTRLAEGATRVQVNLELGHGEQRSLGSYAKD